MATYKTPGVYVEEISLLPPSVAQVETAIPAFIGYTEIAEMNGQDLTNIPTRITSMLDYTQYFGGARTYASGDFSLQLDQNNNYRVKAGTFAIPKLLNMYASLRQYFDNGGGPCYIVSVGDYTDTIAAGDENDATSAGLRLGVKALEKYDEPTMILLPDAANLTDNDFYALQQMAIAQAGLLMDRVAVLDLREYDSSGTSTTKHSYFPANMMSGVYQEFRNRIGINDLSYAAAYTPWLITSYAPDIPYAVFKANVTNTTPAAIDFTKLTADPSLNALVQKMEDANGDLTKVGTVIASQLGGATTLTDRYTQLKNALLNTSTPATAVTDFNNLLGFLRAVALQIPTWKKGANLFASPQLLNDLDTYAKDGSAGLAATLKALMGIENNPLVKTPKLATAYGYTAYDDATVNAWYRVFPAAAYAPNNSAIANFVSNGTVYTSTDNKVLALSIIPDLDVIFKGLNGFLEKVRTSAGKYATNNQNVLYNNHPVISAAINALLTNLSIVPPGGGVAGIYAKTDRDRGVWKAPANSSLNSVVGPIVMIDNTTQDGLNVDADAGKSINAIRTFSGKGTIIWGARTLDGNSNEWRYISVRRFFNMVEESVKNSSSSFVFEPNDANTWVKVKGMIDNYLTTLWRQGALAGAKPEDAFFVRIGLGQTMTAQDILEGLMNVEIGMAAVRPAEFIVLKFSHKMQES